ncbi:hypothetical protein FocnCong_v017526 [Fusarium oxysporum f. sp. conglutinans]|nr:hypothetical protein FocnCong_v017526 [Fusarium oxysporum f. sp. conglutinans]
MTGAKRYVPCSFAIIAPRGIIKLHDKKEEILDHIQRIYLPYTVIDVGWWYQLMLACVPSGKLDHGLAFPNNNIIAGGNSPSALVNVIDVKVLVQTETKTQNEVHELVEKVTGEKPERTELSKEQLEAQYLQFKDTDEICKTHSVIEYWMSWGVRGDNTAENAVYLGYLLASDLYPSLRGGSLEAFIQEIFNRKGEEVY